MRRILLCCALVLATLAGDGRSQETKKEEKEGRNKLEAASPASAVNFSKELAVPLSCLRTLGACIDQARQSADPVELAALAQKLAVAEKVSGKKASLTAEALMKEAVELGKRREYAAELSALAMMATEPALQKELTTAATLAKKRDTEAAAKIQEGGTTRDLVGYLFVTNHTGECLRIYVSGRYVGEVHAGQRATFPVHDHNHVTVLTAVCEGGHLAARRNLDGHFHDYNWHIDR